MKMKQESYKSIINRKKVYYSLIVAAFTFALHLISMRLEKRSGLVWFRFAVSISAPVLYARSIDPEDAETASESLATIERNGKR